MSKSLIDVLAPPSASEKSGRVFGVVVGIVTNNQDPDKMGRVRMKFPWLSDDHESWWARIATPMAGGGRGVYFLPEVQDEVLVAFDHGDIRFPYVVGALWNGKDAPPENNGDGQNNRRVIHSRSGHIIRLDDEEGSEKIEIIDKTGSNSIVIKSSDNSMAISCAGKFSIHASQGITLSSDTDVKVTANATIDIEASAPMTLKGAVVNIN
jgi:uncharacterized protein involved in type VI secretion and phage assembly